MLLKLEIKCVRKYRHTHPLWQSFTGGVESFNSWQRSWDAVLPPAHHWLPPSWKSLTGKI